MISTVFLVDDDAAVRDSLCRLLEADGLPVECYSSGEEFLAGYRPGAAGCLVLDVAMPGMSGLELADVLAARGIQLPIIYLTAHGDIPMSVRAMKAGAEDFFEKPVKGEALIARIHDALARDSRRREGEAISIAVRQRLSDLTPREREVMMLVIHGHHNKEIAKRLGISHRTVELHRSRVMHKTGAATLFELASMATAAGLPVDTDAHVLAPR
jgi:RNA polymerase sigma factor (sigma-70 family)